MRNYVSMLMMKFAMQGDFHPGIVNGFLYVIAEDEDRLPTRVAQVEQTQINAVPSATWTFTFPNEPIPVYVTLNKTQIVNLLQANMQGIYENMVFGTSPESGVMAATVVKSIGNSPRSDFPTSLGTDGQRLRKNAAGSLGTALNYIAQLFFLTSNQQFKDLWVSLKDRKISVSEALAAANILAKSRV